MIAALRGLRHREWVPATLTSPFERLTLPIYAVLFLSVIALIVAFAATSFTWGAGDGFTVHVGSFAILIGCAMLLRRYRLPLLAGMLEAYGLLALTGVATVTAAALLAATALPLTDALLDRADAALGFHWPTLWGWLVERPTIVKLLERIYYSLHWQSLILIPLMFLAGQRVRYWTMLTAWTFGLTLCALIFPLFPARAAFAFYGATYPWGESVGGFLAVLEGVRSGAIRVVDNHVITGMVTFPSFHAAAAVYLAWAAWSLRWLRWPFVALNVAMMAATVPIGGHYLVDIIGGAAIAVLTLWAATAAIARLRLQVEG